MIVGRVRWASVTILATGLTCAAVFADAQIYHDQAAWLAAVGGPAQYTVFHFDGPTELQDRFANDPAINPSYSSQGVDFLPFNDSFIYPVIYRNQQYQIPELGRDGLLGNNVSPNPVSDLDGRAIKFVFNRPIRSVGVFTNRANDGDGGFLEAFDAASNSIANVDLAPGVFGGIVTDRIISHVRIVNTFNSDITFGIWDLQFSPNGMEADCGPCDSGNLVFNGSFEQGIDIPGGPNFQDWIRQIIAPNNADVTGWTVDLNTIDVVGDGIVPASKGRRTLDMNGGSNGSIFQDVSGLHVGGRYRLSFDLSGNPYVGGPDSIGSDDVIKNLRVILGSTMHDYSFDVTPYHIQFDPPVFPVPDMGWRREAFLYTAESTTVRLRFQSMDPAGSSRGPVIDNVRLAWLCSCDTNCDGSINGFDIQAFIDILNGNPGCTPCVGDTNDDGSLNGFDIQGFVECLGG